jgi:hypothetical protein
MELGAAATGLQPAAIPRIAVLRGFLPIRPREYGL